MKKIAIFIIFLLVMSCAKSNQNNNISNDGYDSKVVNKIVNEIYTDGLRYNNLNKVFYDTLFNIDTEKINKNSNQCDKNCYSKIEVLEAIMLLIKDKAKDDNLTFNTEPFYKWKEKVIRGEEIPLDFFDYVIFPTP